MIPNGTFSGTSFLVSTNLSFKNESRMSVRSTVCVDKRRRISFLFFFFFRKKVTFSIPHRVPQNFFSGVDVRPVATFTVQGDGVDVGRFDRAEPARVKETAHDGENSQLIDCEMRRRQLAPIRDAVRPRVPAVVVRGTVTLEPLPLVIRRQRRRR